VIFNQFAGKFNVKSGVVENMFGSFQNEQSNSTPPKLELAFTHSNQRKTDALNIFRHSRLHLLQVKAIFAILW
jgi:hypothetical protein